MAGVNVGGQNSDSGLYFNVNYSNDTINQNLTNALKETGFGAYHTQTLGKVQVGAELGVDKLNVTTARSLDWDGMARTHTGKANGTRYHAGLTAGLGVQLAGATVRPYVGVNAQKIELDSIRENNAHQSTALQVALPAQTHTHAKVGLDIAMPVNDKMSLNAGLSHHKAIGGDDEMTVATRLSSIGEYQKPYQLNAKLDNANLTNAHFGAKFAVSKADIGVGVMASRDDKDTDVGAYVGVQAQF